MTTAVPVMATRMQRPRGGPDQTPFFKKVQAGFRLTWRTLVLVWRSSPRATFLLGALTLAVSLLPLAIAYAGKGIVDAVVAHARATVITWVLIELGVVATQALLQRTLALTRQLLGARLSLDMQVPGWHTVQC